MEKIGEYKRLITESGSSLEDRESLLSSDEAAVVLESLRRRLRRARTFLFAASVALLLSMAFIIYRTVAPARMTDEECGRQLSPYSPILDVVEYYDKEFENHFTHKTKYRGPPTPELEAEWEKLWKYGDVLIPDDKLHLLNRSNTEQTAFVHQKGGYWGFTEAFHQMHCLNILRQHSWMDYYRTHSHIVQMPHDLAADTAVGVRMHIDHCIEELRQAIMCQGDVTPLLIRVDPSDPDGKKADFSPLRKCRRYDKIIEYAQTHAVN